jgi:hypothetical protein
MSQLRQKINTHLEIGKKEPEKGFYFGPLDDD